MLKKCKSILLVGALAGLAGCASYEASMLSVLPVETSVQSLQNAEVLCSWKVFDEEESEKYLGRNLIARGYVPLQLTIRNASSDPMYLNPSNFNIPIPSVTEVANSAYTSTAARVVGWGVPGLLVWPFLIPAIYDGIKSIEANAALDADYAAKAMKELTIQPRSSFNGIVFIPKEIAQQDIELFLVNERTNEKIRCPLTHSFW